MISQRDLVQRLTRRDPGAWSVVERVQDTATADDQLSLQRRDHRTRLTLIVHHDVPRGRGSARLDLDAFDGSADDLVDQAIALALTSVGPAWLSTPPAAPAKVAILDDDLLKRELDAAARSTLTDLHRPAGVTTSAAIAILREKTTIVASSGFQTTWLATSLCADAVLRLGDHQLAISRTARRADDLDLDAALAAAAADLVRLATAEPPVPGPCALWLGPDAILHGGDLGLWSIFAHQADAAIERQGLTRFRLHAELAPGAAQLPEPLSIASDGALDFATRSLPITDDAVAIRRFPLVERGIATGLGLSPREAALRHTDPNGGVRNLVVAPGTWSPPASPDSPAATAATNAARVLEVRRLHALAIDPYTGEATLDIAFGLDHRLDPRTGRGTAIPFTGGSIRLDLITALARARRSSQLLRRGAYHGPAAVLINDADLLA
jgi:PmbA/TldA metallopeptidase C-terminal domain